MELLAYCGLYCGDCASYTGEISTSAKKLKEILHKRRFEKTSKLFPKVFKNYGEFTKMLEFMSNMNCSKICRKKKKGEIVCSIWNCCRGKGYYACYECEIFVNCDKLSGLENRHGDSCVKNLTAIKKMGFRKWVCKGKRLWFGSDIDK